MRLGMNVQRLEGQRLGVGRYLEYLIRDWSTMLMPSEELTLFFRRPLGDEQRGALDASFVVRDLRPELTGFLWENLVLGPRSRDVDVLFGPSYTIPLTRRGRSVVAIDSANETVAGTHSWRHNHTYVAAYRASARRADRVVVPSESTAADVVERYGIPTARIAVVPQGTDEAFVPLDDAELARETRLRLLGRDAPYVLFVGKLSQRRNIPVLIRAFALAKQRARLPHQLLLFGPNHLEIPLAQLAGDAGVADSVVQTDGVVTDHRQLVAVYNAADVFVHPSSYEGWSMTTMEALACGTAVVAANRGRAGRGRERSRAAGGRSDRGRPRRRDRGCPHRRRPSRRASSKGTARRVSAVGRDDARTLDVLREVGAE